MKDPTRMIADGIRIVMARLARVLNKTTKGALLPVHITITSLLGHIPAAWALFNCRPIVAALFIVVFGLMDSLDGALAREQGSVSKLGMFFDAVTDRMKEIILYVGLAAYTIEHVPDVRPWVVVAVAGTSLLVSYVKAKGEMAMAKADENTQELNRMFDGGLARYEIRMTLLVVGLLFPDILASLLHFIIALNLMTAALRFLQVSQILKAEETATSQQKEVVTKPKKLAVKKKATKQ